MGFQHLDMGARNQTQAPLQEQQVLLIIDSSLWSQLLKFLKEISCSEVALS